MTTTAFTPETFVDTPATTPERDARTVEAIHRSNAFHWVGDGFLVSTYFPSAHLEAERVSPFVLMDYGPPRTFAPTPRGKRGVGWHPHRGFETVTLAWEGAVAHRDNAGHAGRIGPGDVQWMTAASGIFHEEYLDETLTRDGGRIHMMQLWVNLPAKDKMSAPGYQPIAAESIPVLNLDNGGSVRIIAGEFRGQHGPAKTFTPITMLDVNLKAGEPLEVALPASYNALAVVAAGRIASGKQRAETGELVLFRNDGARIELTALEDTHLIILSGEPIDEPIVQYGPFVMNSAVDIHEAFDDLERGRFGAIPD